jgi:hypothetical protein
MIFYNDVITHYPPERLKTLSLVVSSLEIALSQMIRQLKTNKKVM